VPTNFGALPNCNIDEPPQELAMNQNATGREDVPEQPNPLMLEGLEFIEYATTRPQALGQVLEAMGFCPVARHRSREVTLYRQGEMNLVVNAHPDDARVTATHGGHPVLSAVAFRTHDARRALERCVEKGAWSQASHAGAMELCMPAIQGPSGSRFYFVDRWREFSIFDIDFAPIPGVDQRPPAIGGMKFFGLVQYVGIARSTDWIAYFQELFGFAFIPDDQRFGIMPKGHLMRSPCGHFLWQLVEPGSWALEMDSLPESLNRIGLGVANVPEVVGALKSRGVEFVDSAHIHPDDRGALTRNELSSVSFELVHQLQP
jgi:4-hydroxyphenylpyruvate dioxygenase